ncbi:uncharacterized protein LOC129713598 [Leucoraja erinacea]|uniref:uncharacterized protein LOC129713598 n=1 Tax=Leucoraja erinaceus TaxID=7782 RepID=UPI0024541218|nr:uncharacterized protein LOC129713598 [Leucoraja erinacea]
MNTVSWFGRSPVGFSGVPLSQDVYHKLMTENGGRGLKVDSLPVQGTSLRTTSGTTPTVGLILRLIGSERPDSILAATYPSLVASVGAATSRDALGLKHQPATQRALAVGSPDPSSGPGLTTTAEWTLSAIQDQASDIAPAPQAKVGQKILNILTASVLIANGSGCPVASPYTAPVVYGTVRSCTQFANSNSLQPDELSIGTPQSSPANFHLAGLHTDSS